MRELIKKIGKFISDYRYSLICVLSMGLLILFGFPKDICAFAFGFFMTLVIAEGIANSKFGQKTLREVASIKGWKKITIIGITYSILALIGGLAMLNKVYSGELSIWISALDGFLIGSAMHTLVILLGVTMAINISRRMREK